jgi:Fe-S cluster assembly protein SufD
MITTGRDHYLAEFARVEGRLPGRQLPWLQSMRQDALASFAETAFPTRHDEDWKYTNVAVIEKGRFVMAGPSTEGSDVAQQIAALALPDAHLLVFVNGRCQPQFSRLEPLPAGVTIISLAEALQREPERLEGLLTRPTDDHSSGFEALNAAFMSDGAYIHLAPGTALERPIHLVFIASEANLAIQPRNIVLAEEDSRASIIEHYVAPGGTSYFTNALTDIVVRRGAQVEHHRLQQESLSAYHIAGVNVDQQHGSRFTSNSFALGGALARVGINIGLNAEAAECALNGLYLTGGRQHTDHHTRIDHAKARGVSRELYKGVLDGASRAVFNGKVIVHPNAQHSDAQQSNRNLLLSEGAEVDTKPQLEIYADDVKCTHGATVGQLDADQLFYLRSRGVDDAAARALLTFAFAAEVVSRLSVVPLRARLEKLLLGRLPEDMKALL